MTILSTRESVNHRLLEVRVANARLIVAICVVLIATTPSSAQLELKIDGENRVTRISGICITKDGKVLLLGDQKTQSCFEGRIDKKRNKIATKVGAKFTKRNDADFESIDQLADGRIVALSERDGTLITPTDNVVVTYTHKRLKRQGLRGLEGLAVKQGNSKGSSKLAVLWEGGFDMSKRERPYLTPRIAVSSIAEGKSEVRIKTKPTKLDLTKSHKWLEKISPPEFGEEFRFRATDLAWFNNGLIVLMPSTRRSTSDKNKERYGPTAIQLFGIDGKPLADPVLLNELLPEELAEQSNYNWEGMCKVGEDSLMVANDSSKFVAVAQIKIPAAWLNL